jgi:polyisoprenyl-phosphate glycosyltransferase
METNKEQNFASAVVYVHNNEDDMENFIMSLYNTFDENFLKYEIIVVNDASTDNSSLIVKDCVEKLSKQNVSILNMSYHHGVEDAMNAGMDLTIGDFVFEFDNVYMDYQPKIIMDLYFTSLKGYDIVNGSVDIHPKLSSSLFYRTFNRYAKLQYPLGPESFRVLSRRAINRIHSMSKTIPYRKAIYANCGLKMKTLKYESIDKKLTKLASKKGQGKYFAIDSIIMFTDVAFRVAITLSALMILAVISIAVYAVVYYLMGEHPVEGWTTTILFLSLSFFGVFTILAILLKYMSVLINLVFKVKKYQFESIEKL